MFRKIRFEAQKIGAVIGLLILAGGFTYAQQWENTGGMQTVSAADTAYNNLVVRNGKYYLSYYDVSMGKGVVQMFDGNSWSYVGDSAGITTDIATYSSLSVDSSGKIYYTNQAGYPDTGLEVRQFDGSSWTQFPNPTVSSVNYQASAVSPANVLFTFSGHDSGTVQRYASGVWEQVGNTGFSGGAVFAEMVIGTNNKVYTCNVAGGVKVYENTVTATSSDSWSLVGGTTVDAASSGEQYNSDIAVDANNNLYVAYVSNSANGRKLNVKKFNGTSWVQLGNANFSGGSVQHMAVAVTSAGKPYVVASRWENDDFLKNTVYQLNTATNMWNSFGGSFISDGEATFNDLAVDNTSNYLVLAYSQDGTKVKRISLAPECNNTDPGNNTGDTGCVKFSYRGQPVSYASVRGADGKIWLQQNLGSTQVANAFDDTNSYGDLFQWGRWDDGHQMRNSATSSAPSANFPDGLTGINAFILGSGSASWWSTNATSDAWNAASASDITSAVGADPCKAVGPGWRLPSQADWTGLVSAEGIGNPASAYASSLKLPAAGNRSNTNGSFTYVGARGYYWSSDTANSGGKYLYIGSSIANAGSGAPRGQGESVRCLKDITGLSTSENMLTIKAISVYPNPTHGILHIKTDSAVESVAVNNVAGQRIPVLFSDHQINMQGLPNGMYIVELKLKNGRTLYEKVIKN